MAQVNVFCLLFYEGNNFVVFKNFNGQKMSYMKACWTVGTYSPTYIKKKT